MSRSGQYSRVIAALGHGVTLQPEYYSLLAQRAAPRVDFMELPSDLFLHPSSLAWAAAEYIREQMPVSLHGEGLGLGNSEGPNDSYLRELRTLVEQLEPALVSDHLCWNSLDGKYCHNPLPLARTEKNLDRVVENILRTQDALKRRILVENIASYIELGKNEMSEAQFLTEVSQQADCWLLLDVGAVYINGTNHGYDPVQFIGSLPAYRVQQLHLACHERDEDTEAEPLLVETNGGPIPESVWSLYRTAIEYCGDTPSAVQWSDPVPSLARVLRQAARARNISREVQPLRSLRASA